LYYIFSVFENKQLQIFLSFFNTSAQYPTYENI
jgi:hypothetical protein